MTTVQGYRMYMKKRHGRKEEGDSTHPVAPRGGGSRDNLQHLFTEIEHRWEEACGVGGGFGRVGGRGAGG